MTTGRLFRTPSQTGALEPLLGVEKQLFHRPATAVQAARRRAALAHDIAPHAVHPRSGNVLSFWAELCAAPAEQAQLFDRACQAYEARSPAKQQQPFSGVAYRHSGIIIP